MPNELRGTSSGTSIPTRHQLDAALTAATALVEPRGVRATQAHDTYARLPTNGVFAADDLVAGENLLREAGLITYEDERILPSARLNSIYAMPRELARESLLGLLLERTAPVWIAGAIQNGELVDALVPDEEQQNLDELFATRVRKQAFLRNIATRVDLERTALVGELAESHVVACCQDELRAADRGDLADQVVRLSTVSDHFGFDVQAPRLEGTQRHLEVKGTTRATYVATVFLSRNEAERAAADPDWSLVVCSVDLETKTASLLGWASSDALSAVLPVDQPGGSWASVKLDLHVSKLNPGLPGLGRDASGAHDGSGMPRSG